MKRKMMKKKNEWRMKKNSWEIWRIPYASSDESIGQKQQQQSDLSKSSIKRATISMRPPWAWQRKTAREWDEMRPNAQFQGMRKFTDFLNDI